MRSPKNQCPRVLKTQMECAICSRTFARPEHLRRHVQAVHGTGRVSCEFCGKQFNRKDSCQRHRMTAHRREQEEVYELPDAGPRRRTRRACIACAQARTKCSGGERCGRCEKRALVCLYPGSEGRQRRQGSLPTISTIPCENEVVTSQHVVPAVEDQYPAINTLFHDNMDYAWSGHMNWLPVLDGTDLLDDFAEATHSPRNAWNLSSQPASYLRSPTEIPLTPSSSLTASASRNRRSVDFTYTDGNGARGSLQQAPPRTRTCSADPVVLSSFDLEFPASTQLTDSFIVTDPGSTNGLSVAIYDTLARHFDVLCCSRASLYAKRFTSARFPSHSYCSGCLAKYQASFQENFSLIHCTTWDEQNVHWILVLAAITIGSSHDHSQQGHQSYVAFTEFLRRAIHNASENGTDCDPLPFAQACILLAVARFNTPHESSCEMPMAEAHAACDSFDRRYRPLPVNDIDPSQIDLRWRAWLEEESRCRLMWYKWLMQTFHAHFRLQDSPIALPLEDYPLPSDDARWEARTAIDWVKLTDSSSSPTTATRPAGVRSLLFSLYAKTKLPERDSGFGKTLLIYCLLARTEEVARSIRDPLHSWKPGPPTGAEQYEALSEEDEPSTQHQTQQWLPANSNFASWRNSACDCLDTLHWAENGDIAMEKGLEKPNVFHLHLSRILLLCPYRALIRVGQRLSSIGTIRTEGCPVADLDTLVLKSLTLDDHKIRLSLVHAGAIFWHCRRYSHGMFYEPFGIFLSALLIVIYGVYLPQLRNALLRIKLSVEKQRHLNDGMQETGFVESEEDELMPDTILLDRPCDDEIVQRFVRKGHDMNVKMSRAGDICLPQGQRVVLEEAIKLLERSQYMHLDDCREHARMLRRWMQRM